MENTCNARFYLGKSDYRIMRLLVLFLFLSMFTRPSLSIPRIETIDGIPHVDNGDQPEQGTEVWSLEKLWTRGHSEDDIIFGLIPRVISDSEGRIYVLDAQLHHVFVFSPEGELIRTLFREGDGPGEIRAPRDVLFMPDGTIGVVQQYPGRIVSVDRHGNPAGTITLKGSDPTKGGIAIILSAESCDEHIVLSCISQAFDDAVQIRSNYLAGFKGESERIRYLEVTNTINFQKPVFSEGIHHLDFLWNTAVDSTGRVFVAPHRDEYRIHVYSSEGSLERVIRRDFFPRKRASIEINRFRNIVETAFRDLNASIEIEETDAIIDWRHRGIRVAPDGRLWVLHSRGYHDQPDGIVASYDVFDNNGIYTKQIAFQCDADGRRDALFFVGSERVIIVSGFTEAMEGMLFQRGVTGTEEEDATPMSITCYRINR